MSFLVKGGQQNVRLWWEIKPLWAKTETSNYTLWRRITIKNAKFAPAIANAIFDATGVRLRDLPFTPERVLRALREAGV